MSTLSHKIKCKVGKMLYAFYVIINNLTYLQFQQKLKVPKQIKILGDTNILTWFNQF